jgi:hypothetical protein
MIALAWRRVDELRKTVAEQTVEEDQSGLRPRC